MRFVSVFAVLLLCLSFVSATTISNDNSTFTGNVTFQQDIIWSGTAYGFLDWLYIQNAPVYNTTQVYNKTEVDSLISSVNITIYGNESAFDGWDKNASDDFDGLFTSLNFSGTTGFADGEDDDTQLSEAQVDAYVADNGYLTSESDPVFSASASSAITSSNITDWNTAYSWGNHALVGYLTSESDPVFLSLIGNYYNKTQIDSLILNVTIYGNESAFDGWDKNASDDFDGAFSSLSGIPSGLSDGDNDTTYSNLSEFVNDVGYLTSETDPVFSVLIGNYYNKSFVYNKGEIDSFFSSLNLTIYGNESAFDGWDKNASDDFDGFYTSLDFSGTTGLSDGIDNDTIYTNLSEFINDVGYSTFDGLYTSLNFTGTTGLSDGIDNQGGWVDNGSHTTTDRIVYTGAYQSGDVFNDQIDLYVGDGTLGAMQVGDAQIFVTDLSVADLNIDGTLTFRNTLTSDSPFEFLFLESTGDAVRFAIPKSGDNYATLNPRSMMIGGDLTQDIDVDMINCSAQGYTFIDCNTGSTGADLGVDDDLEVQGSAYIGENLTADWVNAKLNYSNLQNVPPLGDQYDQSLNTTDSVTFASLNVTGNITASWIDANINYSNVQNAPAFANQSLNTNDDVQFNNVTITGCFVLGNGAKFCEINSTCAGLYSPSGSSVLELCD